MAIIIDTEFGKLPPRLNFILRITDKESENVLYGINDTIKLLKFNNEDVKIPELRFIVQKQGEYIKKKILENDMIML